MHNSVLKKVVGKHTSCKSYHFHHFEVYSSVALSALILFYGHQHHPAPDLSVFPNCNSVPIKHEPPALSAPQPTAPTTCFLSLNVTPLVISYGASQVALEVKNLLANAGDIRDVGLIPGSETSPGGGHGNPLQYSCLKNPTDRGVWWAIVHGVPKSRTRLKRLSMCTYRPHVSGILQYLSFVTDLVHRA